MYKNCIRYSVIYTYVHDECIIVVVALLFKICQSSGLTSGTASAHGSDASHILIFDQAR